MPSFHMDILVGGQLLGQQTAKAVNGVERRAQIMRDRVGKSLQLLVGQAQGSFNAFDFGDVSVNTHPEQHHALRIQNRGGPIGHGVIDTTFGTQAAYTHKRGATDPGHFPVGLYFRQVLRVNSREPAGASPVLQAAAHQFKPGLVYIGQRTPNIAGPDHLRRLLCQRTKQRLLARQCRCTLGNFSFQTGIERADLINQLGILQGNGRELSQLHANILILLGEISLIFIGQLEYTHVVTIAAHQRHGQPAMQVRVLAGMVTIVAPARARLKLRVRHAYSAAAFRHHGVNTGPVGGFDLIMAGCIFAGQRNNGDGWQATAAGYQTHDSLVGTNYPSGLLCDFLQGASQRLVPGDGLGSIGCTLQGKEMLLKFFFCLDLARDIQRHNKIHEFVASLD